MTPTLTNAQKYSSEFGFATGVVVEVIFKHQVMRSFGYYLTANEPHIMIFDQYKLWQNWSAQNEPGETIILYDAVDERTIECGEIKSIRILSGPFSIWNFAPKGAVGCLYTENARTPVMFYKHPETFAIDKLDPDMDGDFMPAPWWWLDGQK